MKEEAHALRAYNLYECNTASEHHVSALSVMGVTEEHDERQKLRKHRVQRSRSIRLQEGPCGI
jgi:hypothetical protein